MSRMAFKGWIADLVDHLVVRCAYTPAEAKTYVTDQPECWKCYYDDNYTPSEAAFEDATS